MTAPKPLPVPSSCPQIMPGVSVHGTGADAPLYWILQVTQGKGWTWFLGQNLTFHVRAASPCNLGIYGPDPHILGIDAGGKTTGRMRSPKLGQPDARVHQCQGNFSPGMYYLVIRSGDNNPPIGDIEIDISAAGWKVFG